ncbi:hypothetical protein D3879_01630 [Pseudomonas cavernicola]|uniref:DUF502 domain-containing protein n=1 Tax=Pseudomonas cavernicola TaxID=2320866 RepID=A0A418XHT6_9PSED|nr:hypothetical protein [Pseudomonas cavernicola]RJG12053.1 hypothetical protein D3879_01630 [Pseudomonas cavernicola]
MTRFIKTTAAGGLLFILPLVLIFILLEKAAHLLRGPLLKLLPMYEQHTVAGITVFTLLTIVLLVVICFLAGLLARTGLAKKILAALEDHVLAHLPGYQLLKDATARMAGVDNVDGASVGLIEDDDGWLFCLVLEPPKAGWVAVYLADAGPGGGTAGEVHLFPSARVRMTELAWPQVLGCLRRGGRGAVELAAPWLPKP